MGRASDRGAGRAGNPDSARDIGQNVGANIGQNIDRNVDRSVDHNVDHPTGARWLWLSLGVLFVDRVTKYAIEHYTSLFFRQPIISDIVVLVHNQNPGIAFGVFSNSTSRWLVPVLLVSAVAMMILLVWLITTGSAGGALAQSGLALILGGAAGNAFDRLIHGSVTDFLEVRIGTYVWPAFNAADSAITIGAALVLFELLFGGRHSQDSPEHDRAGRS